MTKLDPATLRVNLILLKKANHELRKVRILFIGRSQLKGSVESIENGPNFEEEVVLYGTNVDDILFHQQSVLKRFEEYVEIRF